jgi:hypothetical protein
VVDDVAIAEPTTTQRYQPFPTGVIEAEADDPTEPTTPVVKLKVAQTFNPKLAEEPES